MVLKYLVKDYPLQTLYFGIANIVANGLVMLRLVFPGLGFLNRHILANPFAALSCSGSPRISRTITLITWRCSVEDALTTDGFDQARLRLT